MLRFIVRRLAELVVVFFGVTLVIFLMVYALPGDPIAALGGDRPLSPDTIRNLTKLYHLDEPVWQQYLRYIGGVLHGNLGTDFNGRPIAERLATRWPITIRLALSAWILQTIFGVVLGLIAGLRKNSVFDKGVLILSILATSIPIFVLAAAAQLVFGVRLRIFPVAGISDGWPMGYILPAAVIAVLGLASVVRLMRGSVIETMQSDFVRTLWSKGLNPRRVIGIHVLRNSAIPVLTLLAVDLGFLIGGTVVVEGVFNIPGVGQLFFQSVKLHEGPTIVGISTALIMIFLIVSTIVDILNSLLDPRIRYE